MSINKFPKLSQKDKNDLVMWINREIAEALKEMTSYGACQNYSAALQLEHKIGVLEYIKMMMEFHEEGN